MLAEAATLLRPGALDPQTPTCGLDRAPAAELTLWGLPAPPVHHSPSLPRFSPKVSPHGLTVPPWACASTISSACDGSFLYLSQCLKVSSSSTLSWDRQSTYDLNHMAQY